jgi:hypothetical protein
MDVVTHKAEPVIVPPDTYDINGLTYDEVLFLSSLLGSFGCRGGHFHTRLFTKLYAAIGLPDSVSGVHFIANGHEPIEFMKCIHDDD